MVDVARKVARQEGIKLDERQYIAYEIIACTFLLQLVYEGRDGTSILGQYLGSALGTGRKEDMDRLVEHLKARGGMDQLIMFLTGPAGAGKSTAVKVAQRFCFEFCRTVWAQCGMIKNSISLHVPDQLLPYLVVLLSTVLHISMREKCQTAQGTNGKVCVYL